MSKRIFYNVLIIFFLVYSFAATAQSLSSTNNFISKKLNVNFCENFDGVLKFTVSKSSYYKNSNHGLILVSDDMLEVKERVVLNQFDGNDNRLLKSFSIGDNWILVSAYFSKKQKEEFVYLQIINSKGEKVTDRKKIFQISTNKKLEDNTYKFAQSENRARFVVLAQSKRITHLDSLVFRYKVFDNSLNELISGSNSFGKNMIHAEIKDIILSNNYDFYLLGEEYYDADEYNIAVVFRKHYELFAYSYNKKSLFRRQIIIEDKFVNSMVFTLVNDSLYLGGYYSKLGFSTIEGAFSMRYVNDSLKLNSISKFPYSLIKEYPIKNYIEDIFYGEMFRFTAQSMEVDSCGNVYIIGQKIDKAIFYGSERQKGSLYDYVNTAIYNFSDVLLFKIQKDSSWYSIVKKYSSKGHGYGPMIVNPYTYSFTKDKFYFVNNIKKLIDGSITGKLLYKVQLLQIDTKGKREVIKEIDGIYSITNYRGDIESFHGSMYILVREPHGEKEGRIEKFSL